MRKKFRKKSGEKWGPLKVLEQEKIQNKILPSQSLNSDPWCLHLLPGCLQRLSELFQCLLCSCRALNQRQVLLRQLRHQVQQLLGISEVQLRLILQWWERRWATVVNMERDVKWENCFLWKLTSYSELSLSSLAFVILKSHKELRVRTKFLQQHVDRISNVFTAQCVQIMSACCELQQREN